MPSYFFWTACANSGAVGSAATASRIVRAARDAAETSKRRVRLMFPTISRRFGAAYEVARLRRVDVRSVLCQQRQPCVVDCHEADAALHEKSMAAAGDDMAEAHSADCVEREPRLHPDPDVDVRERDRSVERH